MALSSKVNLKADFVERRVFSNPPVWDLSLKKPKVYLIFRSDKRNVVYVAWDVAVTQFGSFKLDVPPTRKNRWNSELEEPTVFQK